jgi:hypothetical protein
MVHGGRAGRELWYHDLLRCRAAVVGDKLTVMVEERGMTAGVHGLQVVVYKHLSGGRRWWDIEVEGGVA